MIEYSKHKGLDDKKCEALLLDSFLTSSLKNVHFVIN